MSRFFDLTAEQQSILDELLGGSRIPVCYYGEPWDAVYWPKGQKVALFRPGSRQCRKTIGVRGNDTEMSIEELVSKFSRREPGKEDE